MTEERNPFATPPADAPRQQEPGGFNVWRWAREHPLLALLVSVWLAAWVYGVASGMYLWLTDPT